MPKKTPQFFQEGQIKRKPGTNRAVYTIPGRSEGDAPTLVLVECAEGSGTVPRNVASFQEFKQSFQKEMDAVGLVAQSVVETFKRLSPGEVEIEFGIELGGAAGIPMITKHEAKANFKVTLKWKGPEGAKS
jgi:hypothetical protein